MSELETIEKLVAEYKPRIEQIFGKKIGDVKVEEWSQSQYWQDLIDGCKEKGIPLNWSEELELKKEMENEKNDGVMKPLWGKIYVNLNLLKGEPYPEREKKNTVHELAHILDLYNNLTDTIQDFKTKWYMMEGFAEYVAFEFPEIYQDEKIIEGIKKHQKTRTESFEKAEPAKKEQNAPYIEGYEFFKKVGNKIGRENILKVFQNPPQTIEEILQPEKYLERVQKKTLRQRIYKFIGGSNGETN